MELTCYLLIFHKLTSEEEQKIHSFIDDCIVIEGSFNWYNTSVFSHDLLVIVNNFQVAQPYLYEFEQIQRSFRVYY